jgi:hypothetical protein
MKTQDSNRSGQVPDNELSPKAKAASSRTTDPSVTAASSKEATAAVPRIKVLKRGDKTDLHPDCKDLRQGIELLMKAIGAEDVHFLQGIVPQLADACVRDGVVDGNQLNFMVSIIRGVKPRDQIEAVLAAEMAAIHCATMQFVRYLRPGGSIEEIDSYGNVLNKLARTFAYQTEVLQRWRSGGGEKVTVQNVSVGEGGQAIVGNVTQNAGDDKKANGVPTVAAISGAHTTPKPTAERSQQQPAEAPVERRLHR